MLAYYGYTISPNQIETGEGFLICKKCSDCPDWRPAVSGPGDRIDWRGCGAGAHGSKISERSVSETALASFEGKPVTDDHPPELLTPDTVTMYLKGHAENVRRGAGEWQDYVVADLHVQDRG